MLLIQAVKNIIAKDLILSVEGGSEPLMTVGTTHVTYNELRAVHTVNLKFLNIHFHSEEKIYLVG